MRSLLFIIYILLFFSQLSLASDDSDSTVQSIGKVVHILGEVQLFEQNAVLGTVGKMLQRGSDVYIGSQIITADRAQVGIRMIDGAVLKIAKNSNFSIQRYDYDPQNPEKSAVKFFLQKGELSSKTGAAGKAAKHQYRLNTPIAAIGIRGTEFIVKTDHQHTRVDVLSGGVIVSPFNQQCALSGSGPCGGSNAVELFADHRNASLILQRNAVRPRIVTPVIPAPAKNVPASSSTTSTTLQNTETKAVTNVNTSSTTATVVAKSNASPPNTVASSSPDVSTSTPLAKGAAPKTAEPSVKWGRWNPDLASNKLAEGYELVAKNADYAIIRRANDNFVLPKTGTYQFTATRYEAYVRDVSKDEYTQAEIQNASLSVDFVDRNFKTEFDLLADNLNTHVQATGDLSEEGLFATAQNENTTTYINGAVRSEEHTSELQSR